MTPDSEPPILPPHGRALLPAPVELRCYVCFAPTPHRDLRTYGARCAKCFAAYCSGARSLTPAEQA